MRDQGRRPVQEAFRRHEEIERSNLNSRSLVYQGAGIPCQAAKVTAVHAGRHYGLPGIDEQFDELAHELGADLSAPIRPPVLQPPDGNELCGVLLAKAGARGKILKPRHVCSPLVKSLCFASSPASAPVIGSPVAGRPGLRLPAFAAARIG